MYKSSLDKMLSAIINKTKSLVGITENHSDNSSQTFSPTLLAHQNLFLNRENSLDMANNNEGENERLQDSVFGE